MFIPDPRWEEPNLLIPGKKPTGPVVIDWSHPLARGLKNAFGFAGSHAGFGEDIASRKNTNISAAFGTLTPIGTHKGIALHTASNSAAKLAINEDWSGPFTCLFVGIISSLDNPYGALFSKNNSASGTDSQVGIGRTAGSDDWYIGNSNFVQTLTATSITADLGSLSVFALTISDSAVAPDVEFYKDGVLVDSATGPTEAQSTGAGSLYLGCARDVSTTYDADVKWLCFYRWNRVLSSSEVASISSNPYQILIPA